MWSLQYIFVYVKLSQEAIVINTSEGIYHGPKVCDTKHYKRPCGLGSTLAANNVVLMYPNVPMRLSMSSGSTTTIPLLLSMPRSTSSGVTIPGHCCTSYTYNALAQTLAVQRHPPVPLCLTLNMITFVNMWLHMPLFDILVD